MGLRAPVLLLLLLVLPGLVIAGTPWSKLWSQVGSGCGCSASCAECDASGMVEMAPTSEASSSCCEEVIELEPAGPVVSRGCTCDSHPLTRSASQQLLPRLIPLGENAYDDFFGAASCAWPRAKADVLRSTVMAPESPPPRYSFLFFL